MRSPLYIRPFLYKFTKVVRTALLGPSSSVNAVRVQSHDAPMRLVCSYILLPYLSTHCQTLSLKPSRPKSCLLTPSPASIRSTTTCVAIPAWSEPGRYKDGSPFIRCQRTIRSSSAIVSACPMCSSPVTFGGGMMTVNGSRSWSISGVKYPPSDQKS